MRTCLATASCSCDADTTIRNGLLTVCTGPSTPPCVCDSEQCAVSILKVKVGCLTLGNYCIAYS